MPRGDAVVEAAWDVSPSGDTTRLTDCKESITFTPDQEVMRLAKLSYRAKVTFKVGDFVEVFCGETRPYVARVCTIGKNAENQVVARMQWFYRLTEIATHRDLKGHVRKPNHNELILSSHFDLNSIETVLRCVNIQYVSSDGMKFSAQYPPDEGAESGYVCHYEYDVKADKIYPLTAAHVALVKNSWRASTTSSSDTQKLQELSTKKRTRIQGPSGGLPDASKGEVIELDEDATSGSESINSLRSSPTHRGSPARIKAQPSIKTKRRRLISDASLVSPMSNVSSDMSENRGKDVKVTKQKKKTKKLTRESSVDPSNDAPVILGSVKKVSDKNEGIEKRGSEKQPKGTKFQTKNDENPAQENDKGVKKPETLKPVELKSNASSAMVEANIKKKEQLHTSNKMESDELKLKNDQIQATFSEDGYKSYPHIDSEAKQGSKGSKKTPNPAKGKKPEGLGPSKILGNSVETEKSNGVSLKKKVKSIEQSKPSGGATLHETGETKSQISAVEQKKDGIHDVGSVKGISAGGLTKSSTDISSKVEGRANHSVEEKKEEARKLHKANSNQDREHPKSSISTMHDLHAPARSGPSYSVVANEVKAKQNDDNSKISEVASDKDVVKGPDKLQTASRMLPVNLGLKVVKSEGVDQPKLSRTGPASSQQSRVADHNKIKPEGTAFEPHGALEHGRAGGEIKEESAQAQVEKHNTGLTSHSEKAVVPKSAADTPKFMDANTTQKLSVSTESLLEGNLERGVDPSAVPSEKQDGKTKGLQVVNETSKKNSPTSSPELKLDASSDLNASDDSLSPIVPVLNSAKSIRSSDRAFFSDDLEVQRFSLDKEEPASTDLEAKPVPPKRKRGRPPRAPLAPPNTRVGSEYQAVIPPLKVRETDGGVAKEDVCKATQLWSPEHSDELPNPGSMLGNLLMRRGSILPLALIEPHAKDPADVRRVCWVRVCDPIAPDNHVRVCPYDVAWPLQEGHPESFVVRDKRLIIRVPASAFVIAETFQEQVMYSSYLAAKSKETTLASVWQRYDPGTIVSGWTEREYDAYCQGLKQLRPGQLIGNTLRKAVKSKSPAECVQLFWIPRRGVGAAPHAIGRCSSCHDTAEPVVACKRYYKCNTSLCARCYKSQAGKIVECDLDDSSSLDNFQRAKTSHWFCRSCAARSKSTAGTNASVATTTTSRPPNVNGPAPSAGRRTPDPQQALPLATERVQTITDCINLYDLGQVSPEAALERIRILLIDEAKKYAAMTVPVQPVAAAIMPQISSAQSSVPIQLNAFPNILGAAPSHSFAVYAQPVLQLQHPIMFQHNMAQPVTGGTTFPG